MGFLDRIVSDLVADSTGIKARHVRGLLRGVGLKNILMIGGAALAGGVAATQASQPGFPGVSPQAAPPKANPLPLPSGATTASARHSPPPLPPIPSRAAPSDLPPLPTGSTQDILEVDLPPEMTFAIARTLVAAAMSDGHLADRERQAVVDNLESSGLTAEQKSQVEADLADPPSPESLALLARSDEGRQALYRFAAVMVAADGVTEEAESNWLDRFARALGLSHAQVEGLDSEI